MNREYSYFGYLLGNEDPFLEAGILEDSIHHRIMTLRD